MYIDRYKKENVKYKLAFLDRVEKGDSFSAPLKCILGFYQHGITRHEIICGARVEDGVLLIASPSQRFKITPYILYAVSDSSATLWSMTHVTRGFTSWFTNIGQPTLELNVTDHDKLEVIYIWDGETKIYNFMNFFLNKEVFKVLNGEQFVPGIAQFLSEVEFYNNSASKKASLLKEAVELFKTQRLQGIHNSDFMTIDWMENNAYGEMIRNLENVKVTCKVSNLSIPIEASLYSDYGTCHALQSIPNRVNARFKGTPIHDEFFGMREYGRLLSFIYKGLIKIKKKKGTFYFKEWLSGLEDGEYDEKDVLLITILNYLFINNYGEYSTSLDFKELRKLIVRWHKYPEMVPLVNEKNSLVQKLSDKKLEKLMQNLTSHKKYMEKLFEYIGKIENLDKYDTLFDSLRVEFRKTGSAGKTQQLNKYFGHLENNFIVFVILFVLQYITARSDTFQPTEENMKTIFDNVYHVIETEYVDYLFSADSVKVIMDMDCISVWSETQTKPLPDSFGHLVATITKDNQVGLDTFGELFVDFYSSKILPYLEKEIGSYTTRGKARNKARNHFTNVAFGVAWADITFINPHGDIYLWDEMDIGHLVLDSLKATLTASDFIFEERQCNQVKYKEYSKDQQKYYDQSWAKWEQLKKEHDETKYDDYDKEDDRARLLSNIRRTLMACCDYHEIEINTDVKYEPESYLTKG